MKKYFLLLTLIVTNVVYSDNKHIEHTHQYIVREAYKLLKYQLGYDIPVMSINYL